MHTHSKIVRVIFLKKSKENLALKTSGLGHAATITKQINAIQ